MKIRMSRETFLVEGLGNDLDGSSTPATALRRIALPRNVHSALGIRAFEALGYTTDQDRTSAIGGFQETLDQSRMTFPRLNSIHHRTYPVEMYKRPRLHNQYTMLHADQVKLLPRTHVISTQLRDPIHVCTQRKARYEGSISSSRGWSGQDL